MRPLCMCFIIGGIGIFDLSHTMSTYSKLCHNFVITIWGTHLGILSPLRLTTS